MLTEYLLLLSCRFLRPHVERTQFFLASSDDKRFGFIGWDQEYFLSIFLYTFIFLRSSHICNIPPRYDFPQLQTSSLILTEGLINESTIELILSYSILTSETPNLDKYRTSISSVLLCPDYPNSGTCPGTFSSSSLLGICIYIVFNVLLLLEKTRQFFWHNIVSS